ncbi:hypothetical protein BDN70DRAFT_996095 [Pholiota conissans]|uniref:Heterokaryon incompatibility domain-containing protein n=1 Tax=Pholiota conissans TaxID=109636 RepID=A0A9P6CWQ0_9AGAR|nr:hypothetical protein BDN70DRAFT_996095 [Pholiota conissans]
MQPNAENDFIVPTSGSSPDRTDQDGVGRIANSQDRALLEALQQFIIPHIGAVANEVETDKRATHSILLKPEATKLITAFKEFIASVSSSAFPKESPKKGTVIRVGLYEQGGSQSESNDEVSGSGSQSESSDELWKVIHMPGLGDTFSPSNQENVAEFGMPQIHPELRETVLRCLREHVFNKMPIRLLCFIPKASHLEISLIERGAIYAHLVSIMQANIHTFGLDDQDQIPENDTRKVDLAVQTVGRYAILSHTWLREVPGEITYGDWHNKHFDEGSPGYQKLVNFCKLAWLKHGLTLGWMDTICINKESSSELDESIRSMYKWYQGSEVCIAYLAETQSVLDIHCDTWFTRGWTLQELVAPVLIKLCNRDWDYFNPDITETDTRPYTNTTIVAQIINQINKATSITAMEFVTFTRLPLSRRMQLAASREVTREEDTAYSVMGIFNVSIATAYGEGGERAFFRLLEAILESTSHGIFDLFNWPGRVERIIPRRTQLFPPSIKSYASRSAQITVYDTLNAQPSKPLVLTPLGIRIPVVLMPGIFVEDQDQSPQPIGDYYATTQFSIYDRDHIDNHYPTARFSIYDHDHIDYSMFRLLDRRATVKDYVPSLRKLKWTLAILNIQQKDEKIVIPRTCIARVIEGDMFVENKARQLLLDTVMPIVFEIQNKTRHDIELDEEKISVGDLAAHGMRFTTLYL